MADWPTLALLKQELGVDRNDKDTLLQQALGAAIEGVVTDCGGSDVEVTFTDGSPTVALVDPSGEDQIEIAVNHRVASAALLAAVMVAKDPDAPFGIASTFDTGGIYVARSHPGYKRLLRGNRVRFGTS